MFPYPIGVVVVYIEVVTYVEVVKAAVVAVVAPVVAPDWILEPPVVFAEVKQ